MSAVPEAPIGVPAEVLFEGLGAPQPRAAAPARRARDRGGAQRRRGRRGARRHRGGARHAARLGAPCTTTTASCGSALARASDRFTGPPSRVTRRGRATRRGPAPIFISDVRAAPDLGALLPLFESERIGALASSLLASGQLIGKFMVYTTRRGRSRSTSWRWPAAIANHAAAGVARFAALERERRDAEARSSGSTPPNAWRGARPRRCSDLRRAGQHGARSSRPTVQLVTDEATALTGAQFGAFFYNVTDQRGQAIVAVHAVGGAQGGVREVRLAAAHAAVRRRSRPRACAASTTSRAIPGTASCLLITACPRGTCR